MKHPASRITLVVAFILLISATLGHSNPSVVYLPVEEEAFLKSGYSNLSMHKAFALGSRPIKAVCKSAAV